MILALIFLASLLLLGMFIYLFPEKMYQYHKKVNFSRSLFKNYDQLEPNDHLIPTYKLYGIFIILVAFIIAIPIFRMIIPHERDADKLIRESSQLVLSNAQNEIPLSEIQQDHIQGLFEDIKIGLDIHSKKRLELYHTSKYLELDVESGIFEFFNEETAYFNTEDSSYPLKGQFEDVYQYLRNIIDNS
jgi:hypothetical protein